MQPKSVLTRCRLPETLMKKHLIILITFLSITVLSATSHNDDNLVLYLSFDETAGDIVQDISDNGHRGTVKTIPNACKASLATH